MCHPRCRVYRQTRLRHVLRTATPKREKQRPGTKAVTGTAAKLLVP